MPGEYKVVSGGGERAAMLMRDAFGRRADHQHVVWRWGPPSVLQNVSESTRRLWDSPGVELCDNVAQQGGRPPDVSFVSPFISPLMTVVDVMSNGTCERYHGWIAMLFADGRMI